MRAERVGLAGGGCDGGGGQTAPQDGGISHQHLEDIVKDITNSWTSLTEIILGQQTECLSYNKINKHNISTRTQLN